MCHIAPTFFQQRELKLQVPAGPHSEHVKVICQQGRRQDLEILQGAKQTCKTPVFVVFCGGDFSAVKYVYSFNSLIMFTGIVLFI